MKKSLFALTVLLGMGLSSPVINEASALEIGDIITVAVPEIPATLAKDATLATLATPAVKAVDNNIASGFIVNSTLAEFGDVISSRTATQADVDASVVHNANFENGRRVEVGDTIGARTIQENSIIVGEAGATWADVNAGAMINSTAIKLTDVFANSGNYGQFVLSGFDETATIGNTVLERIATKTDVDNFVYTSGTTVVLNDVIFGGVATEKSMLDSVARNPTLAELKIADDWVANYTPGDSIILPEGIVLNAINNPIITTGFFTIAVDTGILTSTPSIIAADVNVGAGFDWKATTKVNGVLAENGQMIAKRIAKTIDFTKGVTILEDGEWRAITEQDVTDELIIPARAATKKDVEAGALIDGTELKVGDLYYDGYADADDVTAQKTTGNTLVKLGDTILSRTATAEDINAGVKTGGKLVTISELIPGAVVVTAADVTAGLEINGVAVEAGDIIFLAKDATPAKPATDATDLIPGKDAVIATANDVFEWVISDESEANKAEINGMSQNLTGMQKLTALSAIVEKNNAAIAAGVSVSEKDFSILARTAFGLVPDIKAFNEYNEAVDSLITGTTTVDEIRTKINPDVNSITGSVFTGISAVSSSIGNHQMNLISSSGKYGPKKYLAGLNTGKNSGGSSMNTSTWMEAFISDSTMDTRDSVAGYNASTNGATFGIDTMLANDSIVGFAFSYANIEVDGESIAKSQTDTDQFQGTLYGSVMQDVFFLNASLSYAHSESDTSRTTFGGEATGSYGTDIYSVELGAGMPIVNGDMTITPQTTVRYSAISTDSYTESGSGALDVSIEDMNMLTIKTGVSFEDKIQLSNASFIPKMRLLVDWDILREKAQNTASWVSTGATIISIDGPKPAAFGGSVGVGFDYATNNGLYVVSLDYDMSAKPDYISHAGTAKLRINF